MNVFSWNEGKDVKQQKFSTANEKQYTVLGYVITSTSNLQPSTAIANQSLGKSASTNLNHNNTTMGPACTFQAHYMTYRLQDQLIHDSVTDHYLVTHFIW